MLGATPGCGASDERSSVRRPGAAIAPERVVARVNGVPILDSDLRHQLRHSPGVGRRQALAQLVKLELLAQEAERRGLAHHRTVVNARKRELAQLLIKRGFGAHFDKSSIPRELIERAYKVNKIRYVHPALVSVAYITAVAGRRRAPPEVHQRAKTLMARLAARARAAANLTAKDFVALADDPQVTAAGVKVTRETGYLTPLRGRSVPEFADAAFAIERIGGLSPIVQSRHGYHLIYLERRVPPKNRPLSAVENEIRAQVFEEARRIALGEFVDKIAAGYQVKIFPAALAKESSREAPR